MRDPLHLDESDEPRAHTAEAADHSLRFDDLVAISRRPRDAQPAGRSPIETETSLPRLSDDVLNNGFVTGVVEPGRARRFAATRRTFLRSTIAAAAAGTAATFAGLFGPARQVQAQTGVVGTYPRRILTYCPPYNANDNCQPGCGSSPICTDCCGSDGFFRNDPANGYTLYAGGCGDGDIADGWLWRFNDVCGNCGAIEYRCSDGYVQTDQGPAPFICRFVTACDPLPEGVEGGSNLPDVAVDTNWRPAGRVEQAVDNGGSVNISGWIADATGRPVDMRILANNQIVVLGQASLPRPDIANSIPGAGPNTGFSVSFPAEPREYNLCVNAINGASVVTVGCVTLVVGSGQRVTGSGGTTTITGGAQAPSPSDDDTTSSDDADASTEGADAEDEATTTAASELIEPQSGPPSDSETRGAAQVIRRSGATTGFVSGWAGDRDSDDAAFVDVLVDGELVTTTRPELPRPDVATAFPDLGDTAGFAVSFELPESEAEVCVEVVDPLDSARYPIGCRTVGAAIDDTSDGSDGSGDDSSSERPTISGDADQARDVVWGRVDEIDVTTGAITVRGWAIAPNDQERLVNIVVEAAGTSATTTSGLPHEEAERTYGIDHPCGFEVRVALEAGEHDVRVYAETEDGRTLLGEQSVTVA